MTRNGTAATQVRTENVRTFPALIELSEAGKLDEQTGNWWEDRLVDLKIKVMAGKPTSYWNPTMVGTWVSVITLILALVGTLAAGAFYMGIQHERNGAMQERLNQVELETRKAKDLELLNQRHGEPQQ